MSRRSATPPTQLTSNQLVNRRRIVQDGSRAAVVVEEFEAGVDAQQFVDRGVDVFGAHWAGDRAVAFGVGGTDDLAAADAAAGQEAEHCVPPVIAAGGAHAAGQAAVAAVVHAGRAAEFAAEDHERRLEQAPMCQIVEQSGKETPRQECRLAPRVAAEGVASLCVLAGDVERGAGLLAADEFVGVLVEFVERGETVDRVDCARDFVQVPHQRAGVAEPIDRQAGFERVGAVC